MTTDWTLEDPEIDTAIHPGVFLSEELEARGLTARELARQSHRPPGTMSAIIAGRRSVTPETALDLEKVLGVSARFWLNLQTTYDLTLARLKRADRTA